MNKLMLKDICVSQKTSLVNFDSIIAVGDCEISGRTVKVRTKGGFKTQCFKNSSSAVSLEILLFTQKPVVVSVGYIKTNGEIALDGINPMHLSPELNGTIWVRKDFDPSNLIVYRDAESFFIQVECEEENTITVGEACVWERNQLESLEIYAETLEKMMFKVNAKLSEINFAAANNTENIAVSPNGSKFVINVDDNGNIFSTPIIPNKVLFLGNSLTLGMGSYGMCASSDKEDWVYYVSEAIKAQNPDVEILKAHGAPFEQLESAEAFEKLWNECHPHTKRPMKDFFTDDLDLIIIQLGENINCPERNEVAKRVIDKFISGIKELSPKARIIWVHGFFNEEVSSKTITDACNRWRIGQLCLKDLYIPENCGNVNQEYIKPDGTKEKVNEGWIAHPGNLGMKRIGERVIKFLKI